MVIPIPARRASQGPPTTTGSDHRWWDLNMVAKGICTLDRKMTSFRQSENIVAL